MLAECTPAITWTDEEQHVVAEIRGSSAAGPADRRVKHLLRALHPAEELHQSCLTYHQVYSSDLSGL